MLHKAYWASTLLPYLFVGDGGEAVEDVCVCGQQHEQLPHLPGQHRGLGLLAEPLLALLLTHASWSGFHWHTIVVTCYKFNI